MAAFQSSSCVQSPGDALTVLLQSNVTTSCETSRLRQADKTLRSTIEGMFPVGLAEGVSADIIKALADSGFVAITGTKLAYPTPPA